MLHNSIRVALSYLMIRRLGLVAVATGASWIVVVIFHYLVYRRISF
ncbi:MAG: hypothetical protein ACOYBE_04370 [Blautia sp.]